MTTLADIHAADTAVEAQMNTLLAQMGTQHTAMETAIASGDMDAIKASLETQWQTYVALNDAANATLTSAQFETAVMAAVQTGVIQAAVKSDGSIAGTLPVGVGDDVGYAGQPTTMQPAPGTSASIDPVTGMTTVSAGGQVAQSPAPTGQMPVGTTTGLQPHAGADVSVPTDGDPIATAIATSAGQNPASIAPLSSGGGSGVTADQSAAGDQTVTVAGGNVVS